MIYDEPIWRIHKALNCQVPVAATADVGRQVADLDVFDVFVRDFFKRVKLLSDLVTSVVVENNEGFYRVIYAVKKTIDPVRSVNNACAYNGNKQFKA